MRDAHPAPQVVRNPGTVLDRGPPRRGRPVAMTRLGISIGTTFAADGPNGQREGPRAVLAQARAAARAGLDSLTVGDHHATGPIGYVQNVPIIGRILAEWTERQSGCLFLVPLWHPVLMAEQIGTLAAMADGPFIVQAGIGAGREQFAAMGADLRRRAAVFEEAVRVAQALLSGETVGSEMFGIEGATIAPTPPEGVEWWIGGGVLRSIDRAARLGDCWYGNADLTPETATRDITVYREACLRHRREPSRIPIRKDVLICESRSEAEKAGDALVGAGYRGFDRTAVAYGDPAGVAEQLSVYRDLGFTDIMIRTMVPLHGELGPDAAVRSVELAGEVQALLA
ncbi:MAG: LLM class flavin-dependent oxidoreductase [Actinobacteria bacterium]|nr:MAG: LLM class flavin-dependent oxidoreductase [Actinomycetota bacterium]